MEQGTHFAVSSGATPFDTVLFVLVSPLLHVAPDMTYEEFSRNGTLRDLEFKL